MNELVVFVDKTGKPTGQTAPKLEAHTGSTKLHLAFSCYIFNDKGEFLVTQRALSKKVWPGVWTNSVCGHPMPGEVVLKAIKRRLKYEIGISGHDFTLISSDYIYKTPPFKGIIEHEFCPIYIARTSDKPQPKPDEVENYKWLSWQEYVKEAQADPENIWSWWCKDQLKTLKDNDLIAKYRQPL